MVGLEKLFSFKSSLEQAINNDDIINIIVRNLREVHLRFVKMALKLIMYAPPPGVDRNKILCFMLNLFKKLINEVVLNILWSKYKVNILYFVKKNIIKIKK